MLAINVHRGLIVVLEGGLCYKTEHTPVALSSSGAMFPLGSYYHATAISPANAQICMYSNERVLVRLTFSFELKQRYNHKKNFATEVRRSRPACVPPRLAHVDFSRWLESAKLYEGSPV